MLKSELFTQREQYSNLFRLTNEAINYIFPNTSYFKINKDEEIKRYRILEVRNTFLNNPDKDKGRTVVVKYLHGFSEIMFELNKELKSNKEDLKLFEIEKIIEQIETIQTNIKNIYSESKLGDLQLRGLTDIILEFGILCSGIHSYYLNLETLIENFSIKEEFIYVSFYKNDNEDLNYSEFLLVAEFMNSCIDFIFGEYSDKVHIHVDSGSNQQWKLEINKLLKGEIKMIDSVKDNIKAFFKGLIDKHKNESAILMKNCKAVQDSIWKSANKDIELLDKIVDKAKINDPIYYENELKNIYDRYSKFSEKNLHMSIDSLHKKSSSVLALEKNIMKQLTETSSIDTIE